MRILLVAPPTSKKWFPVTGVITEIAETTDEAVDLARLYEFDVIAVDFETPSLDGYHLLGRLRASGSRLPVLAVSAVSTPMAKVKALKLGADDYLTKPIDGEEMLARARAVVRRSRGFASALLEVGPLQLDFDARQVTVQGRLLPLTRSEYAILELLVLRKGTAITKEGFLNHLYGGIDDEPEIKIIDVFICKLRRKLRLAGCGDIIRTVWGRGYFLRANIPVAAEQDHAGQGLLAA